jgi:hypothetical protein
MSQTKNEQTVSRKEPANLWLFFLGAALVHGLLVLVLSPSLYTRGEDTSPEGLYRKAQALAEEGKYEEAFHTYELLMAKKPQMPAIFEKGEKEMQQMRLKMLEQQREMAQKARAQEEAEEKKAEEGKETETGEGSPEQGEGSEEGAESPPETPADLPELPGIE